MIKKIKNAVPWAYAISDIKGEEIVETLYEKELQKKNLKKFSVEQFMKKKVVILYVKWKGYDSSFNSWIDKKGTV